MIWASSLTLGALAKKKKKKAGVQKANWTFWSSTFLLWPQGSLRLQTSKNGLLDSLSGQLQSKDTTTSLRPTIAFGFELLLQECRFLPKVTFLRKVKVKKKSGR